MPCQDWFVAQWEKVQFYNGYIGKLSEQHEGKKERKAQYKYSSSSFSGFSSPLAVPLSKLSPEPGVIGVSQCHDVSHDSINVVVTSMSVMSSFVVSTLATVNLPMDM